MAPPLLVAADMLRSESEDESIFLIPKVKKNSRAEFALQMWVYLHLCIDLICVISSHEKFALSAQTRHNQVIMQVLPIIRSFQFMKFLQSKLKPSSKHGDVCPLMVCCLVGQALNSGRTYSVLASVINTNQTVLTKLCLSELRSGNVATSLERSQRESKEQEQPDERSL